MIILFFIFKNVNVRFRNWCSITVILCVDVSSSLGSQVDNNITTLCSNLYRHAVKYPIGVLDIIIILHSMHTQYGRRSDFIF